MIEFDNFLDSNIKYSDSKRDCAEKAWNHQQKKIDAVIKWIEENKRTIALEYSGYTPEEYVDADDLLELLK